jgi:hypothetical protein
VTRNLAGVFVHRAANHPFSMEVQIYLNPVLHTPYYAYKWRLFYKPDWNFDGSFV